MISYSPLPFDLLAQEAQYFLRNELEVYDWMHKKELIRRVATHLRTSYATSTAVVDDLHELGLLEAKNGRYRIHGSIIN